MLITQDNVYVLCTIGIVLNYRVTDILVQEAYHLQTLQCSQSELSVLCVNDSCTGNLFLKEENKDNNYEIGNFT